MRYKLTKKQKKARGIILQRLYVHYWEKYGEEYAQQKIIELLSKDQSYKKLNALVASLKK